MRYKLNPTPSGSVASKRQPTYTLVLFVRTATTPRPSLSICRWAPTLAVAKQSAPINKQCDPARRHGFMAVSFPAGTV
jgi:hypothetical protein